MTYTGGDGGEREAVFPVVEAVLYGQAVQGGLGDLVGWERSPGVCRSEADGSEGGGTKKGRFSGNLFAAARTTGDSEKAYMLATFLSRPFSKRGRKVRVT
jgi:hypothetical protein